MFKGYAKKAQRFASRSRRLTSALFLLLLTGTAVGQLQYNRTVLSGLTYTPLSGGGITVINSTAGLTTGYMSANQDDGAALVTLPFTFDYNGNSFTQVTFCTNGWVGMGAQSTVTAAQSRAPANLWTSTVPNNTLAAWFRDGGANFPAPTGAGEMRHGLIGTDVYAFEWFQACGTGFSLTTANLISYQLHIYGPGSSNPGRIEFLYGATVGAVPTAAAVGIENATGGTGNYINALNGLSNSTTTSSWPGNGNGYRFDPMSCLFPSSIAAVGISTNSATVNFTPDAAPGSYIVEYGVAPFTTPGTAGTAGAGGTIATGAGSGIVLTGLTPGTFYQFYVRKDCGAGSYSLNSPVTLFSTTCNSTGVPYTENFNTTIVPNRPPCITDFHSVGAGWVSVAAAAPFTGNMLHRVGTAAAADDWFLTQGLNLTIGQSYRLRFKYGNTSTTTAANLYVYYGNSPSPGSMTNSLLSFATINSGSTVANQAQVDFIPLATGTYYIGFYTSYTGTGTNIRVDDIEVTVTPLCETPTTITTSNITAASADVGFTCVSCVGSYIVEYGVAPFTTPGTGATAGPGGTVVTGGASPVNITGLVQNTNYTVYVRENCGINGYSSNSTPASFTTPCSAFSVPWSDSFENNTTNDAAPLPCFSKEIITGSATTTWRQRVSSITGSGTVSARTGTDFMAHTWSANSWLFSPGMNVTAGTSYDFSFWYAHTAASTGYTLNVGVGTTASSAGMTTTLATITNPVNQTWLQGNYTWVAPSTGVYYFGLQANAPTATPWYMCTDDWSLITTPTCPLPTLVSTAGTTNNSTQVSWTCTGCTGTYIIEYGAPGFTPGTGAAAGVGGTVVTAGSSPAVVTGLTGNTAYQVYVRQDCGAGSYSPGNAGPASFTTLCDPVTAPYTQDFEGGIAPNYGPPTCWTLDPVINTTTSWKFANGTGTPAGDPDYNAENITDHTSGTGFFAWWDGSYTAPTSRYMYSPMVDMSTLTNRYVSLWFYANNTTDVARNTLTVDVWDGAAWLNLITFNSNVNAWTELTAVVPGSVPSSSNFRIGGTVGTLGGSAFYFDMLVDDFKVTEAPTCFAPTGLAAINLTSSSADVAFTPPGAGSPIGYIIEYGAPGFIPGTTGTAGAGTVVTTAASPGAITGLSANTTYQAYVRTDCGAGDYSANAGPITFTTPCNPFSIPWSDSFEDNTTNDAAPLPCFSKEIITGAATSTWRQRVSAITGSGTVAARTGTDFMAHTWSANSWLFSPPLNLTAGQSYDYIAYYAHTAATAGYTINIGVGTSAAAAAMTTIATVVDPLNPAYNQLKISYVAPTTGVYYFGMQANCPTSAPWYLCTDDWSVDLTPPCVAPTAVAASNITATSADIAWTCTGCVGTYIVEYGAPGFVPGTGATAGGGTVVTSATSPASITGLSGLTSYDVYVRQDCGGTYSPNSTVASFATACGGTQCQFTFRLTDTFGDGWNGAQVQLRLGTTVIATLGPTFTTGLGPVDINQSLCNGGNYNLFWSTAGSFPTEIGIQLIDPNGTTIYTLTPGGNTSGTQLFSWTAACPTCVAPLSVAATNVTGSSADISWNCPGCTGSFIVEYGAPGFVPGTGATAGGGTVVTAASSPVTITGLSALTSYEVRVRQDCGGGDFSANTAAVGFITPCSGISCNHIFRLTDTFGDGWNGAQVQVRLGTTVVATLGPTFTTGLGPVDIPVSICSGQAYNLFWSAAGSFPTEIGIQLIDGNNATIYTLTAGGNASGTQIFSWTSSCPTCVAPSTVSTSNITASGADVAWTCTGCTGSYYVEYGLTGFTPGTGSTPGVGGTLIPAASSPVSLSGLASGSNYSVYVRQDCGGGDISGNSAATFSTLCPPSFTAPYSQNFDGNPAPNYGPPACWTVSAANDWRFANGTGLPATDPDYGVENVTDHTTGSSHFAWWDGSTTTAGRYLQSPLIDLSGLTSPWVEFWYYSDNQNDVAQCSTILQAWNGTAWVNLTTASGNGGSWRLIGSVVPGTIPSPAQFRLVGAASTIGGSSFYNDQLVDDFAVKEAPACIPITSTSVSGVTATAANVNWTCTGCTGTFIVEYGPAATFTTPGVDANPGTGGTVVTGLTTSPYALTGLSPETQYRVFVRQDCGGGAFSSNAGPNLFTTSFDCSLSPTITCGQQVTTTFSGTGIWNFSGTFPNNSCGFGTPGQERIFQFNAPAPGQYSIVMGGGTGGYVDWLWKPASGGCSNTGWTCIDDITSTTSTTNFTLPAAGLYYLIGDPEGTTSLTKIFTITCPATNISCSTADPIACGEIKAGNTSGGTNTLPTGACAFNGAANAGGVNWWAYTATADETVTASTCGLAAFNTRISVFTTPTDCNGLVCYAQSDDVSGCASSTSEVEFPVTTGTTYYIAVHGTTGGSFQLGLTCNPSCTVASNDQCPNAEPLTFALIGSGTPTVGDNSCAYGDGITSCSAAGNVQGVWYTFNTGAYSRFRLTLEDVDLNGVYTSSTVSYALFSGACTGNSASGEIACVTNGPGTNNLPVLNTNTTYRLLVYNTGGVGTEGTFGIMLESYAANDAQITSVLAPTGSTCGSQFTPVVIIKNNGTSTLTSATISVNIDGGPTAAVYGWSGSLAFGQQTPVVLPVISTTPGLHTLNVYTSQPNGVADEVPSNDLASSSYDAAGETVKLEIKTDNFGSQTTWVIEDLIGFTVASGGPYPANTVISETRCLPTTFGNCWTLRILDSFGDGMCCANGVGYWRIMDQFSNTLLQDDGIFTTQSPVAGVNPTYVGHEFCIPIGVTRIEAGECNVYTNVMSSKVYTTAVPGNLGGYQFEFSDPDNAYRRRITVTNRYVKFSQLQSSPLTPGTKYFCRSKADPAGDGFSNDNWGPGCDMGLDPIATVGCTQLIDDVDLPTHSCNTTRSFGSSDKIWAQPVLGATQYRFKFEGLIDPDGDAGPLAPVGGARVITQTSYVRVLNWATYTLVDGETYTVTVEVQVSGQWSGYCGAACGLTISNPAFAGNNLNTVLDNTSEGVELYPNPVRDGNVNLSITGLTVTEGEVLVDIYDVFGKRVFTRSIGTEGATELRTNLNLGSSLASGVYMVDITMGDRRSVHRLNVQ